MYVPDPEFLAEIQAHIDLCEREEMLEQEAIAMEADPTNSWDVLMDMQEDSPF